MNLSQYIHTIHQKSSERHGSCREMKNIRSFKTIALIGRADIPDLRELLILLARCIRKRGFEVVPVMLEGRFEREERTLLDARVLRKGSPVYHALAFNDVVVNRSGISGMVE